MALSLTWPQNTKTIHTKFCKCLKLTCPFWEVVHKSIYLQAICLGNPWVFRFSIFSNITSILKVCFEKPNTFRTEKVRLRFSPQICEVQLAKEAQIFIGIYESLFYTSTVEFNKNVCEMLAEKMHLTSFFCFMRS